MIGAAVVTVTVFLFTVCIVANFTFGSYLVCMFLPIGFIIMTAGFQHESGADTKIAANVGLALAAVYAVLILLVYYAQTTTVCLEELNEQASRLLDYRNGGLLFNYDLLGYGIMALSTFFTGLSIRAESKPDLWLKRLMLVHGIFFLSCFFMPMTGMFTQMADGSGGSGGAIALLFWCVYFLPIGVLAFRHFSREGNQAEQECPERRTMP
jgi:hypothetical protein